MQTGACPTPAPSPRPAAAGTIDPPTGSLARIGVDTGGTFCDFVAAAADGGGWRTLKLPSTPEQPELAVLRGLARLGLGAAAGFWLVHGTTVGTNALLEGNWARVGLLVTAGFRGIYEVRDQARPHGPPTFDLGYERARPLVEPRLTCEIPERIAADGTELQPLDEGAVRRAGERLAQAGVEAVAVCYLFSFLRPEHELRSAALLAAMLPGVAVSASCQVLPQLREYVRLATTLANAALQPRVGGYLDALAGGAGTGPRHVMQSSGGVTDLACAARLPAATVFSGPAGGVVMAAAAGYPEAVSFDMGGTSCDVGLIQEGRWSLAAGCRVAGHDLGLPCVDLHTVGAGGGTIGWVDPAGRLRLGPQSAGARPGPACYGLGGEAATVTDADLALGYIGSRRRLGGSLRLSPQAARRAIRVGLATALHGRPTAVAAGLLRLADARMAEAVRAIAAGRGCDLRRFHLVAFGGAGPLHAARVAAMLGMAGVVVPPLPGVGSALGLLLADVRRDYVVCRGIRSLDDEPPQAPLLDEARHDFGGAPFQARWSVDLRYRRQGYELTVPCTPGEPPAVVHRRFDALHAAAFGGSAPDEAVEVLAYRLTAWVASPGLPAVASPASTAGGREAPVATRRAWFRDGGWLRMPVYDRGGLGADWSATGPAVVEQDDSLTLVPPGWTVRLDARANLVLQP